MIYLATNDKSGNSDQYDKMLAKLVSSVFSLEMALGSH